MIQAESVLILLRRKRGANSSEFWVLSFELAGKADEEVLSSELEDGERMLNAKCGMN